MSFFSDNPLGFVPQNRPLIPEAANVPTLPKENEFAERDYWADYDEDVTRRWVSVAVFGAMGLVAGLIPILVAMRDGSFAFGSDFALSLVAFGLIELFFGSLLTAYAYPAAFLWVVLGGALTVVEGIVFSIGSGEARSVSATTCLLLGVACTGTGAWRAWATWNAFRADAA